MAEGFDVRFSKKLGKAYETLTVLAYTFPDHIQAGLQITLSQSGRNVGVSVELLDSLIETLQEVKQLTQDHVDMPS